MTEPGPDRARRTWWLVLAGRVLVLALAATASAYALRGPEAASAVERYRCPMHPDAASSDAAAACPICGMALVRDDAARPEAPRPAVRTERAARRRLVEQVRAPAWRDERGEVVAILYRDDLVGLAAGQPAQFFAATAPSVGVDVALSRAEAWDAATEQVRFAASGATPGPGSLVIAAQPRDLLVVPSSAVLESPEGPYVLVVDPASHRAVKRAARIGREHHGVTAVLGGLAEGDEVVIGDAFFVAAEQLLHPEVAP